MQRYVTFSVGEVGAIFSYLISVVRHVKIFHSYGGGLLC